MICDFVLKKCHFQSGLVRDHHNGTLFVFFTIVSFSFDVFENILVCYVWNESSEEPNTYVVHMYLNTRCDLTNYFLNPCPCLSTNFKYVFIASAKENSSKRRIALNESSKKLVLNREFRERKIQRFCKQWRSLSKWISSSG